MELSPQFENDHVMRASGRGLGDSSKLRAEMSIEPQHHTQSILPPQSTPLTFKMTFAWKQAGITYVAKQFPAQLALNGPGAGVQKPKKFY